LDEEDIDICVSFNFDFILTVYVFIKKNMGHRVSVPNPVRIRVKSQPVCRMVGSELTGDIGIVGTDLGTCTCK